MNFIYKNNSQEGIAVLKVDSFYWIVLPRNSLSVNVCSIIQLGIPLAKGIGTATEADTHGTARSEATAVNVSGRFAYS